MEIRRMRTLALDIFQILKNLNPNSMKGIFNLPPRSTHRKHDILYTVEMHQLIVIKP